MKQIKNDKLIKTISLILKELREIKSLTQEEVMDEIKINKDLNIHIGRIETGRNNPTVSTLFELCEYYEISISEFFNKVEEVNKSLKINKNT